MSEQSFEGPAVKRLERSRDDRMLAGVSGGLARYFEIHPAFYRVGFVVLTLLGGAGIVIYLAAALVMPDEGKEDSVVTAALRERRDRPWPLIGLALLAAAGVVLLSHATLWPQGDAWIVLLLAGGAILWLTRKSTVEPPAPGQPRDAAALATQDSHRIKRLFVGFAILIGSLVALVLVSAAIFAAVVHVHLGHGIGERTFHVAGTEDLRPSYKLGIGELILDLRGVELPTDKPTTVKASVDVGRLEVRLPSDATVRVHGDTQFGNVTLLGRSSDGHDVDKTLNEDGPRVLNLDAHVGAGSLHVYREIP
jgi:phage shock protein PspC (stress-responsive transcriptional regulator)